MISFTVPIRTQNESNGTHGHWAAKAGRRKRHNAAVAYRWPRERLPPLLVVTLTRVSPRRLDDDGLRTALKAIRDGVASKLKVDDDSDLVRWEYAQAHGAPGEFAVRVDVRRVTT